MNFDISTARMKHLCKRVVKKFLRETGLYSPPIPTPVVGTPVGPVTRVFHGDIPQIAPLHFETNTLLEPRLNLMLPIIRPVSMSGGPNTALHLAAFLAKAGVPIRLLSVDAPYENPNDAIWNHFRSLTGVEGRDYGMSLENACAGAAKVPLSTEDVFFATAWWTAQKFKHSQGAFKNKKFVYLIQDFEPGLYQWSTEYALALETYSLDMIPVVNTHILARYLIDQKIGRFASSDFVVSAFEPSIDDHSFYFDSQSERQGRRRMVFYARPSIAPRNLFEIGLAALYQCQKEGWLNPQQWEVSFIGESLDTYVLGDLKVSSLPWMSFSQYCQTLRQTDIVLSLMLSPHPSYTPLEAAAAGALSVTNTYPGKSVEQLQSISKNIIAVEPTVEGVTEGLKQALLLVGDLEYRERHSHLSYPTSWEQAFDPILPSILKSLKETRSFNRL